MEYSDWQQKWKEVVEKGCNDYSSLSRDERIWYNIRVLIDSVNNGGIISYYYNCGADYMEETLEDLGFLGFKEVIKLVDKLNKLFPNGKPSKDLAQRNEIINLWEDGRYEALFESIDEKFSKHEEKMEKSLEPIILRILQG